MPIKGKILVKHYLNKKLSPDDDGGYPLYVYITLKRKKVYLKSRVAFLSGGVLIDQTMMDSDQKNLLLDARFKEEHINTVLSEDIKRERILILRIGEFFKSIEVNFVDNNPSKVIDVSLTLLSSLISLCLKDKLIASLESKGYSYTYDLIVSSKANFNVFISALNECGSKQIKDEIISDFNSDISVMNLFEGDDEISRLRVIDWLTNDTLVKGFIEKVKSKFGYLYTSELAHMLNARLRTVYSGLGIDIPQMVSFEIPKVYQDELVKNRSKKSTPQKSRR